MMNPFKEFCYGLISVALKTKVRFMSTPRACRWIFIKSCGGDFKCMVVGTNHLEWRFSGFKEIFKVVRYTLEYGFH